MAKNTRAPKRRNPSYTPLQRAILTGGPLPDELSAFYTYNLEHPDNPGLIGMEPYDTPFAEVWKQYHGRDLTEKDRAYIADRVAEIRARKSMATTREQVEAQTPDASNWPATETDGFEPVARVETDDDDDND